MATDAEACAYLYTRSLESPMDNDWAEIYLYVATKLMEKTGMQVPDDIRKDSLNDHQFSLLSDLKRWIYRKRTGGRKGKRLAERNQAKAEVEEKAALEQLTLPD